MKVRKLEVWATIEYSIVSATGLQHPPINERAEKPSPINGIEA
jgi:hypothetical protein